MDLGPDSLSRTSQAVALTRAAMTRPRTEQGDPDAQRRLCEGMTPIRRPRPGIWARTRFFDDQVMAAVGAGIPQVVICGAGYDDRALRFRSPGVRFIELDHPATQADKSRRLSALGSLSAPGAPGALGAPGAPGADGALGIGPPSVVLAPADFRHDDPAAVLAAGGHDTARPTLFLCEGLLIYLDESVVQRLLAALRSRAAQGSSLAASLATHPDGLDSAQVAAELNAGRRHGQTEPWLTLRPAAAWLRLLAEAGWDVCSQADPRSGSEAEGRSLLVVARAQELSCTAAAAATRTPPQPERRRNPMAAATRTPPQPDGRRNPMKPGFHLARSRSTRGFIG
jgi:O-methyltransferase involved in polyketide biosynthesis